MTFMTIMKPPLLVTAAIITDQNKVLLVKRAREPFKGFWSFIGGVGAFEHAADPEEAVKMEVAGDIGCTFYPLFFGYNYEEHKNDEESKQFDLKSVVLYFYGNIKGDPVIDPRYVSEWKWASFKEAIKLELAFEHQKMLRKFLQAFPHQY